MAEEDEEGEGADENPEADLEAGGGNPKPLHLNS